MKRLSDYLIECRVLGNIMISPEQWYEIAGNFKSEYFADPALRQMAQLVIDLTAGGQKPSSVRILRESEKRNLDIAPKDLIDLVDKHVTARETKALMGELIDLYKRRTAYQTLANALADLEEMDKPTDELIAAAQQSMIDAFGKAGEGEVSTMHDVAQKMFERQERIQRGEELPTYPLNLTGLQTLVGGFNRGSLNIVAGRPSMGKTAFVLSECLGWGGEGLPGIIFSMEQEEDQLGERGAANVGEIPLSYLRQKLDKTYLGKFYSALSALRELPIVINDKRGLTAEQICSIARVEKMKNPNLTWIAIDYLQIMSFPGKESHHLKVGQACLQLRNLAKELGVFVVLLSQLNRGLEMRADKRPLMSDLRDSGNIEEHADTILFLYRQGYYDSGFLDAEMGDWITEIEVAKNRQGGNAGKRTLAMFNQPYMKWSNCPSNWAQLYKSAINK